MEIRLKSNHEIRETVVAGPLIGFGPHRSFVRACVQDGKWEVFSDEYWERVPENKWRNVTAECEAVSGSVILHGGRSIMCRPDEFQVRKVGIKDLKAIVLSETPVYEQYDVFIVEKLEEMP